MRANNVIITQENSRFIGHLPQEIQSIIKSGGHQVDEKVLILSKNCVRDVIRRVFFVNSVDNHGVVTSLRQMKYYYRNAVAKGGITQATTTKKRDLELFKPDSKEFEVAIGTYLEDGYVISLE